MVANTHDSDEDARPTTLESSDVVFLFGTALAIIVLALILIFTHGERAATPGILRGWMVQISIWFYLILSAI